MKVQEILEKNELRIVRSEVELFSQKMLEQYLDDLGEGFINTGSKEIFDPIWGPVEFNAGEIALLDSPLMQRLRKIKQLGLASYVYCGADYSRFAHTIGVFYLAGEMAKIIKKQLDGKQHKYNFAQIVRLAAIFHDVGHMYFSHVSERYFVEDSENPRYEEIKRMLIKFSEEIDDNVSLHELLGVMIVNSSSVKKMLKKIAPALEGVCINTDEELAEIIEYISCMIIGQANGAEMLPYYQIINGPVDADKCDYLSRDSHATNVPVAVDIFRLIHKMSIEKGNLPESLEGTSLWEDDKDIEVYYPTIKASAIEALNQLLMARASMYNSVYYHQKVRTAETMLWRVLKGLGGLKASVVSDFTQALLMTDDVFGYHCFYVLEGQDGIDKRKLKCETDKLNKINFRMLMKRSCSIGKENIEGDEEKRYLFEKDILMLHKADKIKMVETETKKQYEEICGLLNVDDKEGCSFIIMEFPKVTLSDSIPDATISYGHGEVKKIADIFQTGTWIESKESRNKEEYMVTDCENRELAFLALQKVLFSIYGVHLLDSAAVCSKVSRDEIKKRKKRLLNKGYYNDSMVLVADIILANFNRNIKEVCDKYQTYEGVKGKRISKKRLESFLKQFLRMELNEEEGKSLIDGILKILQKGIYIDRKYFDESIEEVFKKFGSSNIHLCPLGGEKDSAFHMMYYLNDIDTTAVKTYKSLQEALGNSSKGDQIVFFDDGAYSGKQVSSIIEEYMGVPLAKRSTQESHVTTLTEDEKKKLKECTVGIAYICFNTVNKEIILKNAREAGMNINQIEYMHDMKEKIFQKQEGFFKDEKQKVLVKKALKEIGFHILDSVKNVGNGYKTGWSLERVTNASLGYNDAQQMVILKSSVPTYTLTAFWCGKGKFKGEEWHPLFVRTSK